MAIEFDIIPDKPIPTNLPVPSMSDEPPAPILTRRIILTLLLGGLVILSYAVLQIFLVPLAWAAVLAFSTWPLYTRLQRLLRRGSSLSALTIPSAGDQQRDPDPFPVGDVRSIGPAWPPSA